MITVGIVGLTQGDFTPTWSGVPQSFPARHGIAYLCAGISLLSGIGLLFRRTALVAARVLLGTFVAWFALFRVPLIFGHPTATGAWWPAGDTAVMIAAGVALVFGVYARLAAALSALQMGLFTVIVWIPILLAHPSAADWAEALSSLVLTAAGWVVADSYRGTPWLAVGKR